MNKKRNCPKGLGGTPTYRSWYSMLDRCQRPSNASWRHYGGRGITVTPQWQMLDAFVSDMGLRPEGTTLDRIDPNKGYGPDNCRWAPSHVQSRNRRNVKLTEEIAARIRAGEFDGLTNRQVGAMLDVDPSVISRTQTGAIWRVQP